MSLAEQVKTAEGHKYFPPEGPFAIRLWLFAQNGVIPDAKRLLREHQIYWSTRADLDALIALTGLRKLPDFSGDEPGSGE